MKINSIIINNYKSIGEQDNKLVLENDMTAIIGKNESGKSNILKAISHIQFKETFNKNINSDRNRMNNKDVSFIIHMSFTKKEKQKYNITDEITIFNYSNEKTYFEGGLTNLIKKDKELNDAIKILENKLTNYAKKISNYRENVTPYMQKLSKVSNHIFYNFSKFELKIKEYVNSFSLEDKEIVIEKVKFISNKLNEYYNFFPIIYYRQAGDELKDRFTKEEVLQSMEEKKDILYKLMKISNIDIELLKRALDNSNPGDKQHAKRKINKNIEKYILSEFNKFYTQDTCSMEVDIEGSTLKLFFITSEDNAMVLSERSNGLKWYFNFFVDILYNNIGDNNAILLIDEPGIFLHVNAQKELLNLLGQLTREDLQLIYTTQSPYMLDSNNLQKIRAVQKDKNGYTHIYKSAYDQRLFSESQMDTLSPLVKAIGSDLRHNLGPDSSRVNIITEGITDYLYLKSMFYYIKKEDPYDISFIPSVSVTNIDKIASILIGWGYSFKVILDFDKEGRKECKELTDKLDLKLCRDIFYVNLAENNVNKDEEKDEEIEDLISEKDKKQLSIYINSTQDKVSKIIIAREFHDLIKKGEITLSKSTIDRFKNLFEALKILD